MSEDKHFRRALVPGLGISALLIGVGFWQSITMGIVCLVGCGANMHRQPDGSCS